MLKITLRAARVNAGYKLVEAAKEFGVNKDTLSKYEKDSSNIPRRFFIKLKKFIKFRLKIFFLVINPIFFGNTK